jgi:hypothetical protein
MCVSGCDFEDPPKRPVRRSTKCVGGSEGGGVVSEAQETHTPQAHPSPKKPRNLPNVAVLCGSQD